MIAMTNRHRLALPLLMGLCLLSAPAAHAGGYVNGTQALTQAKSVQIGPGVSTVATFDNATLTDQNTIAVTNNDPIKTPSTSDPVSTVTGNNYHDETDLMIRGRGLNLAFTRTFNSAPSATKVDIGLGYGWVHSYAMRLKSNDYGACANCSASQAPENGNAKTSSITYTDERGGEHNYLVNESTLAASPPQGEFDSLAFDTPVAGQHTLAFRNGAQYVFETIGAGSLKSTPNVSARLKQIKDPWGNQLNFAYDANGHLSGIADNLGIAGRTGLSFSYDAAGHMSQIADWSGRAWKYSVDASGNLMSYTDPLNQSNTYGYSAGKHLLTSVTRPLQRDGIPVQTTFAYYQNGKTFSYHDALGNTETLDYDLYRKSTRVTDPRGGVRDYEYDASGNLTKLTEPDRAILQFQSQADGLRYAKRDGQGYLTQYSYRTDHSFNTASDTFGNVTREQDALGQTIDTGYGPYDQVASVKDKRGNVMTTTYATSTSGCDYANRPKETRISALNGAANVLLSSYCWNNDGTLNYSRRYLDATHYTDTKMTYEAGSNGLNVSQQQMLGQPSGVSITQSFTYDTLGRKKTQTLQRRTSPTNAALINLTTSFDYDALDRVVKTTDPLGNETLNSFDANGQLWQVVQRYKKPDATYEVRTVMTRTFDAAERVKSQTDAAGNITQYQYDTAGNRISVTDAENHTSKFEYDPMNRRTAAIDATGYRTETRYSLRGDVLSITNANNETIQFENDALGRKTAAIDPKGYRSEFQYDANGNLICTIDANAQANLQPKNAFGCSETRTYDELNRAVKIVDALGGETNFTYDLAGNRLTVKDAENKTYTFAYDDLGRLKSETDHLGLSTSYKLDEAGNVYERSNRLNETTRISYDNGNRATRIDYLKDGTAETFGYDPAGNRSSAANDVVGYGFAYDSLNRLTQKTDSRGKSLTFTFDKVGNILTKTTYQGSTTSYQYNAANRLVSLTNPDYLHADYQYDPAGRLLSRVISSGARTTYQYDANGASTKLTQSDAANATISDTSYTRDRVGNILTQTDASGATTYTYDALYRLKSADYPGAANDEAYTYDKVGNRQTKTQGSLIQNASTRYYNYNAGTNRLSETRIGSVSGTLESAFSQDLEGRLVSQSGINPKTLTWDAKGRLKTVNTETYSYDPMDYRIQRSGGTLGNLDYFLEGEHLESVYDASGVKEKYFRGASIDELVAGYLKDTDGKTKPYLFHHDNVNSVSQVSGHNGGVIQATAYGAFGNVQGSTGSSPSRLMYTGRENDGTGLYYYRARDYDPEIGRFISEDPMGFQAGINFYAYVGNNPVNANDPTGLAGLYVYFSGYQVDTGVAGIHLPLGHAAVVAIDNKTGKTQYYDFGRFNPKDDPIFGGKYGVIRGPFDVGTIQFDKQGVPTQASFDAIKKTLSEQYGKGDYPNTVYNADASASAIAAFAEDRKLHLDQYPYTVNPLSSHPINTCINFAAACFQAGIDAGANSNALTDSQGFGGDNQPTFGPGSSFNDGLFGSQSSAANGGFLIYPNKSNTNQLRSVYAK